MHHIENLESKTKYSVWVEWTKSVSLQKTLNCKWNIYKRNKLSYCKTNKQPFDTKDVSDDKE